MTPHSVQSHSLTLGIPESAVSQQKVKAVGAISRHTELAGAAPVWKRYLLGMLRNSWRERGEEFLCKMVNHYCFLLPWSICTYNLVISRFNCFLTPRIKEPALLSISVANVSWVHLSTSPLVPFTERTLRVPKSGAHGRGSWGPFSSLLATPGQSRLSTPASPALDAIIYSKTWTTKLTGVRNFFLTRWQ